MPGDPGLRQHDHLVVLLPYVDAGRVFRVAVFERSAETSTGSLAKRYPSDFIHLVRFDARGDFDPLVPGGLNPALVAAPKVTCYATLIREA